MSERPLTLRTPLAIAMIPALLVVLAIAQPRSAEAFIYWAEGDSIARAELDGSGADRGFIRLASANALGLALGGGSIFWTHNSQCYPGPPDGIGRAALDGTAVNEGFITAPVDCGGWIAAGSGHLYWVATDHEGESETESSPGIARASLDGSTIDPALVSRDDSDVGCSPFDEFCGAAIAGVAVDAGYLYWVEGQSPFTETLVRANLDGTGVTALATGIGNARSLAVDGQYIYWATGNSIGRANLDGSGVTREFIDAKSPVSVAVDSRYVYWEECCRQGYGSIHRATIDGSGIERDLIEQTGGSGLAVDAGSGGGSAAPGTVKAKKTQRQRGERIRVKVQVRAAEGLKAKATGKVKPRYTLKPARKRLDAGDSKTLTLKVKATKARETIADALARGRTAIAKLTVKLSGEDGDKETDKLKVKLKAA